MFNILATIFGEPSVEEPTDKRIRLSRVLLGKLEEVVEERNIYLKSFPYLPSAQLVVEEKNSDEEVFSVSVSVVNRNGKGTLLTLDLAVEEGLIYWNEPHKPGSSPKLKDFEKVVKRACKFIRDSSKIRPSAHH